VHTAHAAGLESPPGGVPAQSRPAGVRPRRGELDDGSDEPPSPGRAGAPARHRRPRRCLPLRRLVQLFAVATLVLIAGRPMAGDALLSSAADSIDPVDQATAGIRDWVLGNLDPGTALLVPSVVAAELSRHGHQADRLIGYGTGTPRVDWRCCPFLITLGRATARPEEGLPAAIKPAYQRSRPLALFTGDGHRAEIREIFPEDVAAARAALVADRAARVEAAADLVKNSRVHLAPAARVALLAGSVDSRVLIALAGVTGKHAVDVAGFPVHPGEATTGVPRRAVRITAVDGRPVHPDDSGTNDVQTYLMSQVPPYRPDALPIAREGRVRTLTISFRAPSPIGLLAPAS
jgi:hypothetical protein